MRGKPLDFKHRGPALSGSGDRTARPNRPWRLGELSHEDLSRRRISVAVIPLGSTEAHSHHLPYAVDAMHCEIIADLACAQAYRAGADILLLPALPYGLREQGDSLGEAVTLRPETLRSVLDDLVGSLGRHHVPQVVLLNGHTGNVDLCGSVAAGRAGGPRVSVVSWWKVAEDLRRGLFERPGAIADEMETSMGLAYYPRLVSTAATAGLAAPRLKAMSENGRKYIVQTSTRIAEHLVELCRARKAGSRPSGGGSDAR